MNILREVRRVSNKSMPVRIMLLLAFCVIFVVTTYAWFSVQRDINVGGLTGYTTSWDVAYYIKADDERDETQMLDKTAIFTIDEFYPGMPDREDTVHVYNIGKASTTVTYELTSVKVFGKEILIKDEESEELALNVYGTNEDGEEIVIDTVPVTTSADGKTTTVFSGDTRYPFKISYTYDKTDLIGQYEEGGEYEDSAHATLKFYVEWDYEGTGTDNENLAKDVLDTQFGKGAYTYYQDEENDPTKAVEVQVRITSNMIHPSDDENYPYEYPYGQS